MGPSVIDGDDWIGKRLAFLRERLTDDLADDERRAVEAELQTLSGEKGIMPGGLGWGRFWRRVRRPRG